MSKYDKNLTDPMKKELTSCDVEDLVSPEGVDDFLKGESAVLFFNSVCGCSAGIARPAFIDSLQNRLIPKKIGTVFAGVDEDAVSRAREYVAGFPPSSPSIAFFRNKELVHILERKDIEGFDVELLKEAIIRSYNKFAGPDINEKVELKTPAQLLEKSVSEVKKELDEGKITLLDCRTYEERDIATIPESELITQEYADEIVKNWNRERSLVIYCHHGDRSLKAALYFKQHGFKDCTSMAGGIHAWAREIDSDMATY